MGRDKIVGQDMSVARPPSGKRRIIVLFVALAALVIGVVGGLYLYNNVISGPVREALAGESGAQISVHRRNWISSEEIVFDIRSVEGSVSAADMTRRLLKAAEALQGRLFSRVYLAHRGEEKFYLDGAYFQRLGREYGTQNPIYTIRTLPENLFNPDGSQAFGTWTGGWLGVLNRQLEDSNEFHRRWWQRDASSGL